MNEQTTDRIVFNELLQEVLSSPDFKDSKRYQDLLMFLATETLEGRTPKEVTIAMQFFGKDATFDSKEDPTVRVYINNLRKKLEHFYLSTERESSLRIEIPKGHYRIEIVESTRHPYNGTLTRRYRMSTVILGLALLVMCSWLFLAQGDVPSGESHQTNPLWREFVEPGSKPTMIVLGDFFFLFERTDSTRMGNFVRDLRINSSQDYRQAVRTDPEFAERYFESNFTFLRPSASWGLAHVLPLLWDSPNGYSLKLASEFTVDDLEANNIVFIGSFKSLFALQKFLHVFNLEYTLKPASFRIYDKEMDTSHVFVPFEIKGGAYEKDFAVITKGNGPKDNTILLMLGFSDTGVLEAALAASDQTTPGRILERLPPGQNDVPNSFTLVLESEGLRQAIFRAEIRQFVVN